MAAFAVLYGAPPIFVLLLHDTFHLGDVMQQKEWWDRNGVKHLNVHPSISDAQRSITFSATQQLALPCVYLFYYIPSSFALCHHHTIPIYCMDHNWQDDC